MTTGELMRTIQAAGGRFYLRDDGAELEPRGCAKALIDAAVLRGAEIEALLKEHLTPCAGDAVGAAARILKVLQC